MGSVGDTGRRGTVEATHSRVRTVGLQVGYGDRAVLSDVTAGFAAGTATAVLGRNGAGKTSLVKAIVGLLAPMRGAVEVDGVARSDRWLRRHSGIGYMGQETGLFETMTLEHNLRAFAAMYGTTWRGPDSMHDVIEALELGDLLGRRVNRLSGGQRRRVHMAIGLIGRPGVLVLDEPTLGADVQSQRALRAYCSQLKQQGACVIYVTNQMSEVRQLCDEAVVFHGGRTVFQGDVDTLVDEHSAPRLTVRGTPGGQRPGGTLAHDAWRDASGGWEIRGGPAVELWARLRHQATVDTQGIDEVAFHAADVEDAFLALTGGGAS